MKTNINVNTIEKYAIVDSNNKVIEKFRLRATAVNMLYELRKDKSYYLDLRIISLKD